ncbi:MAG: T9SS type A sorting domain-containing protein [Melioribacteraceae bacterium]
MKINFLLLLVIAILAVSNSYAQFTQQYDSLGLVVIPAEKFSSYRPGLESKAGDTFVMEDSIAGFMGTGYMRAKMAKGDGSISNAETINIKLSYSVKFIIPGTYYIWAYVYFPNDKSDSFFFGLDGKVSGQVAGQPRGVWSWHKGDATINIDTAGTHTIDFFGREPNACLDHIIITSSPTFDPNTNTDWESWGIPTFVQRTDSLGLVVIPAWEYDFYRPGLGSKIGDNFAKEDSIAGFMGEGYMRAHMAKGDGSISNAENINIKLTYKVEFVNKGNHYIWAYVFFPNDKGDSFFFGLDGKVTGQIAGQPRGQWSWHKGDTPINVDTIGLHTVDIFGREPNSCINYIILTSSPTFDPKINKEWQPKPKGLIAFVSLPTKIDPATGENADKPFIDALKNEGYNVYTLYSTSIETASQSFIDSLNSADLVIIGRSGASADFGGSHKTAWNNITSPLLLLHPWAARNNRLNWLPTSTTTSYDTAGDTIKAKIEFPEDSVFIGIPIASDSTMDWVITPYDFMATTDGGNGKVLARESISSNVLFVRWEPWKEFYKGSVDMPAGYRTLIGNGNDHAYATLGLPMNYYNFTKSSERVFLNEVARMIKLGKVEKPVSVEENNTVIPITYSLEQNYPNPFNPVTVIKFSLPEYSYVKISVYDILGRLVTKLVESYYEVGYHQIQFNASNLTSGIYFYKMEAIPNSKHTAPFQSVKKMMLLK